MNFFAEQERARRQSRYLLWLFLLSVVLIVLAVNAVLVALYQASDYLLWHTGLDNLSVLKRCFWPTTLCVVALIGGAALLQIWRLREGGDAVARMAGGTRVPPSTSDPAQRRLLNVVEEMALASGIAVPNVYVLLEEGQINAFAAGYSPNQAIIALTRGALEHLSRDELQGVVGHEFSHILHGDMRLNIQLLAAVYGLRVLADCGEELLPGSTSGVSSVRRIEVAGLLFVLGSALWIIGHIGALFARLICACVAQQREFLADASAVRYTRNRDGIGQALRKIGGWHRLQPQQELGSEIKSLHAASLSHLFLGAVRQQFARGWFATHPPLSERIKRIYGRRQDMLTPTRIENDAQVQQDDSQSRANSSGEINERDATTLSARAAATADGAPNSEHSVRPSLPQVDADAVWLELSQAAHQTDGALALVYALLLSAEPTTRAQQRALLGNEAFSIQTEGLFLRLAQLPPNLRVPLLDLLTPSLRSLAREVQQRLLEKAQELIMADGKVVLEEFVLHTILTQRLKYNARSAATIQYQRCDPLLAEIDTVFSLLACSAVRVKVNTEQALMQARTQAIRDAARTLNIAAYTGRMRSFNVDSIQTALGKLNALAPLEKPRLIKSFVHCATRDGVLAQPSQNLLRAICAALDCPLPPQVLTTMDFSVLYG
ncbi:MAG: M48 family metalloprotease [Pseudomonadota bacterium]